MKRPILSLLLITWMALPVVAQDDTDESHIDALVGKLRNLSILFIDTDSDKMIERQKEKIETFREDSRSS